MGRPEGKGEDAACCKVRVEGEEEGFCSLTRVLLMTPAELDGLVDHWWFMLSDDGFFSEQEVVINLFRPDCVHAGRELCSQFVSCPNIPSVMCSVHCANLKYPLCIYILPAVLHALNERYGKRAFNPWKLFSSLY